MIRNWRGAIKGNGHYRPLPGMRPLDPRYFAEPSPLPNSEGDTWVVSDLGSKIEIVSVVIRHLK